VDDDAHMAFGTVLAVLARLFERNGLCSTMEFANMIGNAALATSEAGPEYKVRGEYIGAWAHCVLSVAKSAPIQH
jgi:hypothetical protein